MNFILKWLSPIGVVCIMMLVAATHIGTKGHYLNKLAEQQAATDRTVALLESTIGFLDEDMMEGARLMGLATEFNTTPTIVQIVDHYSQAMLLEGGHEWHLIRTHENFTHLMLSLMWHESKVDTKATGDKGKARGLTQIWTTTAQLHEPEVTAAQLLDAETNIRVSMQHFQYLLQHYEGNDKLALLAWNRGKARVDNLIALGQNPENGFAESVRIAGLNASRHAIVASFMEGD